MARQQDRNKKKKEVERKKREKVVTRLQSSSDFATMSVILSKYGLRIFPVEGDGNCLFRSFGLVFTNDEHKHAEFRAACCDFMESHEEEFKAFIEDDEDFPQYLARMRKDAEWGTQLELTALCRCYKVAAVVFQADGIHYEVHFQADDADSPTVLIAYHDQEHFNAVAWARGEELLPLCEIRRRLRDAAKQNSDAPRLSKREVKTLQKTAETRGILPVKEVFVKS